MERVDAERRLSRFALAGLVGSDAGCSEKSCADHAFNALPLALQIAKHDKAELHTGPVSTVTGGGSCVFPSATRRSTAIPCQSGSPRTCCGSIHVLTPPRFWPPPSP